MSRTIKALLILSTWALSSPTTASPPPPPPAFIGDIAQQLMSDQTSESFPGYAKLFAPDLTVTQDGRVVAASKAEWLAIEQARLGKTARFIYGYAKGRDNILIFDRFDDKSDERCPQSRICVFDPRYHARAVQYQLGTDQLVHFIRIVQSDGLMQTPSR